MARLVRKRRAAREVGLLEAAGRGAVAGLVGGVAMTLLDRQVVPAMGRRDGHVSRWDRQVARGAKRAGVQLQGRHRTIAGVATTLVYGAVIGAAYGVARTRLRDLEVARSVLDTGLVYAATLVAGEPAVRGRSNRGKSSTATGARGAVQRGSGPAVFGRATMTAFHYLMR